MSDTTRRLAQESEKVTYRLHCPNCGEWWDPEPDVDSPVRPCPCNGTFAGDYERETTP